MIRNGDLCFTVLASMERLLRNVEMRIYVTASHYSICLGWSPACLEMRLMEVSMDVYVTG